MIIFVRNGRSRILKGFKIQNRSIILVNINVPKYFSNACYQPFITLRKKKCVHINMCPVCTPAKIKYRFMMKMTI